MEVGSKHGVGFSVPRAREEERQTGVGPCRRHHARVEQGRAQWVE